MADVDVKGFFLKYYNLNDEDFNVLFSKFKRIEVPKGTILIESEKVSDEVFLIESGIMRTYFWDAKGNEVTLCFGISGDFFASMFCYFKSEPAFMQYEAVTEMTLYTIKKAEFESLCMRNLSISNLFRIICLEQLYSLERKCKVFGKDDAMNKYISLIKVRPQIIKEVPLKHIASYLGITQQSLSRLRASLGKG